MENDDVEYEVVKAAPLFYVIIHWLLYIGYMFVGLIGGLFSFAYLRDGCLESTTFVHMSLLFGSGYWLYLSSSGYFDDPYSEWHFSMFVLSCIGILPLLLLVLGCIGVMMAISSFSSANK